MLWIKEWWEFFPAKISPFDYNDTVAKEYHPLSEDKALEKWWNWRRSEYQVNVPSGIEIVESHKVESLKSNDSMLLNSAIQCKESKKTFRIIKPELQFYKKYWVDLPTQHPDVRHISRMKKK